MGEEGRVAEGRETGSEQGRVRLAPDVGERERVRILLCLHVDLGRYGVC